MYDECSWKLWIILKCRLDYKEIKIRGNNIMSKKIELTLSCFAPTIIMEIEIPQDRDAEEYIDEFLESILAEDFRYNTEWNFM